MANGVLQAIAFLHLPFPIYHDPFAISPLPVARVRIEDELEWRNWQTQQTQNLPSIKSNH